MKLAGRENMAIIKTDSIITQKHFDLKALNRHLIEKQKSII